MFGLQVYILFGNPAIHCMYLQELSFNFLALTCNANQNQNCRMVYSNTNNPNSGIFLKALEWKRLV
jgi:hypothetical protein